MKENLPKEQCGMLKFYICYLAFLVFSFFSHCVSRIMHIECCFLCLLLLLLIFLFVLFVFVQRKCWFKIGKDMLSTSQSVDLLAYRAPLLFLKCREDGVDCCLSQPLSLPEILSSHWLLISHRPTLSVEYLQPSCVLTLFIHLNFRWFCYFTVFFVIINTELETNVTVSSFIGRILLSARCLQVRQNVLHGKRVKTSQAAGRYCTCEEGKACAVAE